MDTPPTIGFTGEDLLESLEESESLYVQEDRLNEIMFDLVHFLQTLNVDKEEMHCLASRMYALSLNSQSYNSDVIYDSVRLTDSVILRVSAYRERVN